MEKTWVYILYSKMSKKQNQLSVFLELGHLRASILFRILKQ